jgi:hypothetical protein
MYFIDSSFSHVTLRVVAQIFVGLRATGAPGKSFRAQSLYYVDAGGASGREHRSDYRRA